MTRKEEREQAARKYINCNAVAPESMQLAYGDFIEGAMWADATAWKPSDKQIEALEDEVRNNKTVFRKKVLKELLEQLKKLLIMEAPKKIYLTKNLLGELCDGWDALPSEELFNVEYVRKDAFIEKAREWLRNNSHNYANNALGKEYLVNDFVNYMKGE